MTGTTSTIRAGSLEKLLSVLSLAYSFVITVRLWYLVALQERIWLFPGLYFMEVVCLPALASLFIFQGWRRRARIACISAGASAAFSVLGAFTVGLFYVPVVFLLLATALASRKATHEHLSECVAFFFGSAFLQAFVMISMVTLA